MLQPNFWFGILVVALQHPWVNNAIWTIFFTTAKGTFCVFWKLGVALAPRFLRPCTYWEHWYDWEPWEFVHRCHYANANINGRVDFKKMTHLNNLFKHGMFSFPVHKVYGTY
jgi:hypothetical protein